MSLVDYPIIYEGIVSYRRVLYNPGIDLTVTDGKRNYVLNVINLFIEKEAFAMMDAEEVRTIFNLNFKQNYSLLRFAVGLFSTINNAPGSEQYKCGYYSFGKMPERTGIEEKSCKNYFKLLEDNEIIYVHHSETAKRDEDGQIKNLSNTYGRPCDKKIIDKYYVLRATREGYDFTKKMDSKKQANVTRRYNKYVKGTFKGDVAELIKDVIAYNQCAVIMKFNKEKDMDVFDNELLKEVEAELQEQVDSKKEARQEAKEKNKAKKAEQPKVTKVAKVKHEATPEMFAKWDMNGSSFEEVKENMAKQEAEMRKALMLQEEKQRALEEEMYNNPYSSYNSFDDELFW